MKAVRRIALRAWRVGAAETRASQCAHLRCHGRRVHPSPRRPPTSRGGLNAFSAQMRHVLSSVQRRRAESLAGADAKLAEEQAILSALMAQPLPSAVKGKLSDATHQLLHPLLCVRVLEQLGYPVLLPTGEGAEGQEQRDEERGWLMRRGWAMGAEEEVELRRVFEHVLLPLQPLLGTAAMSSSPLSAPAPMEKPGVPMHPQLRPVLPLALAWWCVYRPPSSLPNEPHGKEESDSAGDGCGLSDSVWLAHLVAYYTTRARGGVSSSAEESPASPDDRPSVKEDGVEPLPLASLLPFVFPKAIAARADDRDALVDILALCLRDGASTSFSSLPRLQLVLASPSPFVNALFWSGHIPLLSHPRIQEGLQRAAAEVVSSVAAAGPRGSSAPVVVVQVCVDNDDTLRRFLLRMAALMDRQRHLRQPPGQQQSMQPPPLGADWQRIFVEPVVAAAKGGGEAGEDNELRWINPLFDFVSTQYATPPSAATASRRVCDMVVQLSFTGVLNVLAAVLDRLQTLRHASSCNTLGQQAIAGEDSVSHRAATGGQRFTLLPHKPRVHTVKRTCELLLHHARRVLAAVNDDNGRKAADGKEGEGPWFRDVSVAQQEAVLRRLCGVSRALVRVAMEEKRVSLLTEGPEGAALMAGGAVGEATRYLAREEERGGATAPVSSPSPRSAASLAAVSLVLRNAAFRALEPALWRLYSVDAEVATTPALSALPSLLALLPVLPCEVLCDEALGRGATTLCPDAMDWAGRACDAVSDVYRDVGGATAWETARQLLRHPLQQPSASVVEGVRLLALHELLFTPTYDERLNPIASTHGDAASHGPRLRRAAEQLVIAVQSVWGRCGETHRGEAEDEDSLGQQPTALTALQLRLGLLCLLVLVRLGTRGTPHGSFSDAHSTLAHACHIMLQSLTRHGQLGTEWSVIGVEALLPRSAEDGEARGIYWEAGGGHSISSSACSTGGDGGGFASGGAPSRWELLEGLREAAAWAAGREGTTWQWLGSPAAVVRAAVRERAEGGEGAAAAEAASPKEEQPVRHYLVPWTTVAESRQPLRLYDESGQSSGEAAEFFDHHLQKLLSCTQPDGFGSGSSVVIRFVGVLEELTFFSEVARHQPTVALAEDIRVMNEELRLVRTLGAQAKRARALRNAHHASNGCDNGEDEDYDGLD